MTDQTADCTCLYYGRGLSETRVVVNSCPVHRDAGAERFEEMLYAEEWPERAAPALVDTEVQR